LGQFEVRRDGQIVQIPSRPAQSLLAYLALNRAVHHRREKLAGLLWPDSTEANARANLRAALWRLRKSVEEGEDPAGRYLRVDEITLGFEAGSGCWLDVEALERKWDPAGPLDELLEAVSVYRGELLPGFYDEWIMPERERLRAIFEQRQARLLERLVEGHRWAEAVEWGERWIGFGGAPEPAFQALMQAHAALGDRLSLAAAYQRAVEALRRELGAEPSAETQALFDRLQAARQEPPPPATLPAPSTPFVGRAEELRRLAQLLADPACRLLTLIGPGGIGKTRLALEAAAAQQQASAFQGRVYFAPLASLPAPSFLASAIATALGLTFHGLQEPRQQLIAFLRDKRLLLVLDNFEHILEGASLLADLLASAPGLSLLVTSRERLNLQGEWLFEVAGLEYPTGEYAREIQGYSAVALFLQVARRVHPGFRLSPTEVPSAIHICQLVAGAPLAVELAAAWVRHLPVAEIAQEIERNLDLLTTELRDVPERHRSLRATFDHSWNLLNAVEQAAFRRLSVFRGGFERNAAAQVAGVSAPLLAGLVDKSLVERAAAGRFDMHSLLHQYAAERLAEAGELETYRRRHRDFFLELAQEAEVGLKGRDQLSWSRRMEAEHDNERAALAWSLYQEDAEAALRLAAALEGFWYRRGYVSEGSEWQARALAAGGPASAAVRSKALRCASILRHQMGHRPEALQLAEEALALSRQSGDQHAVALALGTIGTQLHFAGENERAVVFLEDSVRRLRECGDRWALAAQLLYLADTRMRRGDLTVAAVLWEESLTLFRELGDSWGIAFALGGRGDTARLQGDYRLATALLTDSLALVWEQGNRIDIAYTLEALAILATAQRRFAKAARLWGAAEALRDAIHAPLPPGYQRDYRPYLDEVRAELGQPAFEAAWAEGRAMALEQATAYAQAGE
jgi:predicted ATPase/DNA-binding SARP family transcriptional activator